MRISCLLCDILFENDLELEVHELSLSHHIKLEASGETSHICSPCSVTCATLGEYSKHVDSLEHRKRRDRMRAIIDTMDAGEQQNPGASISREQRHAPHSNYLEPSVPFIRNDPHRRTYPAPNHGAWQGMQPRYQENGSRGHLNMPFEGIRFFGQPDTCGSRGGRRADLAWSGHHHQMPSHGGIPSLFEESRRHFLDCRRDDVCTEMMCCQGANFPRELSRASRPSSQNDGVDDQSPVPPPKRGILARLSLRGKKDKSPSSNLGAGKKTEKPAKRERRVKKKKSSSQSQSPASSAIDEAQSTGTPCVASQAKRAAPIGVSMKDKTKKWELVAVKGKASYLKNRSQRLLKDRMSKYRLVDSKGVVVEDVHEEEPTTSTRVHCRSSKSSKETAVPRLTSHIWGTGPEAKPRSQQKTSEDKPHNVSFAPSVIAPCPPRTSGGGQYQASHGGEGADWNDTSSGYATMNGDFPMSTPKNYDSAVRAYENYQKQGFPIPDTLGTTFNEAQRGTFGSCSNNADNSADTSNGVHDSAFSVNSSLAIDSRSIASRMDLTALPNITRNSESTEVKQEPGESPPPDALPSPPQFDQTVVQKDSENGKIAGEKEREEFWTLGVAEMKKGREIVETRAKIEKLQNQIFEATSALQQMEVEMNEILRRKAELLGLPVPGTFV